MFVARLYAEWLERHGWGYAAHDELIADLKEALALEKLSWDGKLPLPVPGPTEWDAATGRLISYGIQTMNTIPRFDIATRQPLWKMWLRIVQHMGIVSALSFRLEFQDLRDRLHSKQSRNSGPTH